MKKVFVLALILLANSRLAYCDLWKCQKEGQQSESYTDTPTGEPGVNCEKVEAIRFSGNSNKPAAPASAARTYPTATDNHITSKVKAKVKAPPKSAPAPEKKQHTESKGSKGGNHPSGKK